MTDHMKARGLEDRPRLMTPTQRERDRLIFSSALLEDMVRVPTRAPRSAIEEDKVLGAALRLYRQDRPEGTSRCHETGQALERAATNRDRTDTGTDRQGRT